MTLDRARQPGRELAGGLPVTTTRRSPDSFHSAHSGVSLRPDPLHPIEGRDLETVASAGVVAAAGRVHPLARGVADGGDRERLRGLLSVPRFDVGERRRERRSGLARQRLALGVRGAAPRADLPRLACLAARRRELAGMGHRRHVRAQVTTWC
jgi:hypothetical protein